MSNRRGMHSLVALGAILALAGISAAQVPTSEQLQMFQGLPADQQQAVLRQVAAGSSNNATNPAARHAADRNKPAEQEVRRSPLADPPKVGLQPDDVVLVELDLFKERIQVTPVADTAPPIVSREPVILEPGEKLKLEALRDVVRSRNPYRLDAEARLLLPGFAPISIGGLSEQQATQRLSAEPVFLKLDVKVVKLPVSKQGQQGLRRFGYDLFDDERNSFSPVVDIPVPSDYVVGPGDEISIQLFGGQSRNIRQVVTREGTVSIGELGPIQVAGQAFSSVKTMIEARVSQQMIGMKAHVSMGELRSIRVFVLGEAKRPGSYTVSGLSTMTSAIFSSGGVQPIGSLRDIQLKRQGNVIRRLDLYDLLVRGDTSDDAKLQAGDVIFIPPVGPTVSIDGEVKRPAIYETRNEKDAADLVALAGGLTPEADALRASLTRIDEQRRRVILDVDLARNKGRTQKLRNGDSLRIERLRPQIDSGVMLAGAVHRPGSVPWREGMRLTDVLGSIDELKPNADSHYVLVRRETGPERRIEVLSADLGAALTASGSEANLQLMPRDQITVFELAPGRERIIKPLLEELRLQSGISRPTEIVRVGGRVKVPGDYPLERGMRVSDLLRAGGNLDVAAYGGKAELARYDVSEAGARQTRVVEVDLSAILRGERSADFVLNPFDFLLIKETTDWSEQQYVTLQGEVRFPGNYPIRVGETLRQVIDRAGGLTQQAFARGSVFTRVELREREQKQLETLADRMQSDLASLSLQASAAGQAGANASAAQAMQAGQALMAQLRQSKAVGRLVLDLPGVLGSAAGSPKDVIVRSGDTLFIPKTRQEVTVLGEVQNATSHLFERGAAMDDYIRKSGGMTRKADKAKTYVVRADGSVIGNKTSMFRRSNSMGIQPGDTIVVPFDTERMPQLPLWQAVTQIVYNLSVSLAAVKTF